MPNGIISRYGAQLHYSRAYQFTPKVLFRNRFQIFSTIRFIWILFLCRYLNLISVENLENFFDDEDSKVSKAVESSESIRHFQRSRRANDSLRKLFRDSKRLRYVQILKREREPIPVNIIANPLNENTVN